MLLISDIVLLIYEKKKMIRLINGFADIYSMGKFVNEYSYVFKMETSIRICFKLFYRANTHDGNDEGL